MSKFLKVLILCGLLFSVIPSSASAHEPCCSSCLRMETKQYIGAGIGAVGGFLISGEIAYALLGLLMCSPWRDSGFEGCVPKEYWTLQGHPLVWVVVGVGGVAAISLGVLIFKWGTHQKKLRLDSLVDMFRRLSSDPSSFDTDCNCYTPL